MASAVVFIHAFVKVFLSHIHLAANNWLEVFALLFFEGCAGHIDCFGVAAFLCFGKLVPGFAYSLFYLLVVLFYIVEESLYAEHIAVVSHGKCRHTVGHGFLYEAGDRRKTVEQRV